MGIKVSKNRFNRTRHTTFSFNGRFSQKDRLTTVEKQFRPVLSKFGKILSKIEKRPQKYNKIVSIEASLLRNGENFAK